MIPRCQTSRYIIYRYCIYLQNKQFIPNRNYILVYFVTAVNLLWRAFLLQSFPHQHCDQRSTIFTNGALLFLDHSKFGSFFFCQLFFFYFLAFIQSYSPFSFPFYFFFSILFCVTFFSFSSSFLYLFLLLYFFVFIFCSYPFSIPVKSFFHFFIRFRLAFFQSRVCFLSLFQVLFPFFILSFLLLLIT